MHRFEWASSHRREIVASSSWCQRNKTFWASTEMRRNETHQHQHLPMERVLKLVCFCFFSSVLISCGSRRNKKKIIFTWTDVELCDRPTAPVLVHLRYVFLSSKTAWSRYGVSVCRYVLAHEHWIAAHTLTLTHKCVRLTMCTRRRHDTNSR